MITVVTLSRNERYLAPFFLRHYEFADRIVVFDNRSTDGTVEFLSKHPKVQMGGYDTGGKLDDGMNLLIKNTAYHALPGEWFIIVDFDEFVYHENLRGVLDQCLCDGTTLPSLEGWQMIGVEQPLDDGETPLTAIIMHGVRDDHYSKRAIVHRDVDIRYGIGGHNCDPVGRVVVGATDIKLLHYNWLSREHGLEKRAKTATQLSDDNLKNSWGLQCNDLDKEARCYDDALSRRVQVLP